MNIIKQMYAFCCCVVVAMKFFFSFDGLFVLRFLCFKS